MMRPGSPIVMSSSAAPTTCTSCLSNAAIIAGELSIRFLLLPVCSNVLVLAL